MVHKQKRKYVKIDWNSKKSIEDAERKKARYENMGLTLLSTRCNGVDKDTLVYG
jgi:hypothetical protein